MTKANFYLYQLDNDFLAEYFLPVMACLEFGERSIDNFPWAQNAWVRGNSPVEDLLPAVVRPQDTLAPQYGEPITRNFVIALGATHWSCLPSKKDLINNPPVQEASHVTDTTPQRPAMEVATQKTAQPSRGPSEPITQLPKLPPRQPKSSKQATQPPTSTPPIVNFEAVEEANRFLGKLKGRGRPDRAQNAAALAKIEDAKLSTWA